MAPSLQVLSDGEIHRARSIVFAAADFLGVTDDERAILIPSGQVQFHNRGNWALSYLARANAVERTSRGYYRITDVGRKLLADNPEGITERDLRDLAGYESPYTSARTKSSSIPPPVSDDATILDPQEMIAQGKASIDEDVSKQLLQRIWASEPVFFEQAVLDLMMAMGYGGADGRATRTQLSNDGGIDGVIDQDALGLSRIYVQAKRYAAENTVGREAIQAFVGALAGRQANQGVFITSSRFSKGAYEYADSIPTRVILIDGDRLTQLMIRYGVGVQVKHHVQIVEVDEDFFE
ncbi:MAG: restriction endonuclease [Gordonia sp. (in: high G+C Gram-positive bacteria)]|uniref:restriction endonuclease n=1 Tax=Gordonia sp. (in: high G+C Gram-positive bacteria) TaxID=84139 RepID=UPI0039E5DD32